MVILFQFLSEWRSISAAIVLASRIGLRLHIDRFRFESFALLAVSCQPE
jgi:hypothetical protein